MIFGTSLEPFQLSRGCPVCFRIFRLLTMMVVIKKRIVVFIVGFVIIDHHVREPSETSPPTSKSSSAEWTPVAGYAARRPYHFIKNIHSVLSGKLPQAAQPQVLCLQKNLNKMSE